MWRWLLPCAYASHGVPRWEPFVRPLLRPQDAQLGWRAAMGPEPTRRFFQAVRRFLAQPLSEANGLVNHQGGAACMSSGCAAALGTGACDQRLGHS